MVLGHVPFTENTLYFLPFCVQNILQIGISLIFSHLTPNCAKSESRNPMPFYKSFSSDFYELVTPCTIHLAVPHSLDYELSLLPLNSYILSLQQYKLLVKDTQLSMHSLVINFIWEQFSSPEWLATILEKKERIKVPIYLVIGFNKKPRRKLNVWLKISSFFKIQD